MEATQRCSAREAARILRTTESRLLRLARLGGVMPEPGLAGVPEFTFQQMVLLRTTQGLLDAGVPPRRVANAWAGLRRQLPSDLPLTGIRVQADGHRPVASDGAARWQPESGQFLLNLGDEAPDDAAAPEIPPTPHERARAATALREVVATPARDTDASERTAEQWFHVAAELEAHAPDEARDAYRHALELDPDLADAHLNLGRLEHEAGELGRAEAHYRDAVRLAPEDPTSHFNLGVLLEDRGRPEEAILAYRQAIVRDPDAGDAHYNLGLLLESRGRKSEAIRHLMTARRLYDEAGRGS
jgi:tetratricopeptide (TPR) repeat protein